ncbi:MAG: hypothetical protein QXQ53_04880 [Candidatus Methanosuratincola sp.]
MRAFAAEVIFWLHLVIVLFWVSLFFVPVDWWQGRISFHFYFSLVVILHQFVWGAIIMPWTKRYRMVCILTTLMQSLRGFKLSRVENYGHSFTEELFARARVNVPKIVPTILTLSIVAASFTLYFLHR